jgi:chloramphenicol 3-O-phosphotransferase
MVSLACRAIRQDIDDGSCDNTNLLAGTSLETKTRRRKSRRKRKPGWLTKQQPLLMHQQIHHLLSP